MGPRMFIRGNVGTRRTPDTTAVAASMGPRMFIRGNLMMEFSTRNPSSLQWGRGCSSAETRSQRGQRQPRRRRFNGAADVHPRKHRDGGHQACPHIGFNGAADVHPRKRQHPGRERVRPELASMGPRMFIRGNGRSRKYRVFKDLRQRSRAPGHSLAHQCRSAPSKPSVNSCTVGAASDAAHSVATSPLAQLTASQIPGSVQARRSPLARAAGPGSPAPAGSSHDTRTADA